jgi:zeaxanthin glucosyltransferase
MEHFALICPPLPSHVTGMTAIARELIRRGHRATMFNIADARGLTLSEGTEFVPVGTEDHPEGSLAEFSRTVAQLKGIPALRFGIRAAQKEADSLLRDVPAAMQLHGVTAIIGDQGSPVCSSIAERFGMPFFTVCNAIAANRHPSLPPSFAGWKPGNHPLIRLRNQAANLAVDSVVGQVTRTINRYRRQWGLPELRKLEETFSPHAQISQQSEDFDFPNPSRPRHFHYVGLLRRSASDSVPFPFELLDGRPVLYASLGTVMGSAPGVYRKLALACEGLPVQLVITLGGAAESAEHANLPGNPIVVRRAPQLAILRGAALTFCHAGLNTVLESLSFGVPVLALPMVTDQFAVGARLWHSGAGEAITRKQFDSPALRETISRLLTAPSYRARAAELAVSLRRSGGEMRAADIIERAIEAVGGYSDGSARSIAETSVVIPA